MRRQPRRGGVNIILPGFCLLLCAAAVLACGRLGGDDAAQTALQHMAQNSSFLRGVLALEMGIYPDTPTVLNTQAVGAASSEDYPESSYTPSAADASKPQKIASTSSPATSDVKIANATNLTYNIPAMLQKPVVIRAKQSGPQVLLIHTHTTEAYTQDSQNTYVPSEKSESQRTLDKTKSVVRVGDEIQKVLESRGISVLHCKDVFDYPAFNGCYARSLAALQKQLAKTPSVQIIIDVHRDSIAKDNGTLLKTSCKIGGKQMAQCMLVMGTNASGLSDDHWAQNLNYAVNLQKKVNATYPSLMRPINLRQQRFNEHLRTGSMLLEVGSSGNTLPEAISAAHLFANVLADDLLGA